jgi:hypothetical protein
MSLIMSYQVDHILTGRSIECEHERTFPYYGAPLIRSFLLRQIVSIFVIHAESTRSEYVAA